MATEKQNRKEEGKNFRLSNKTEVLKGGNLRK